jgi:hypothetical protein
MENAKESLRLAATMRKTKMKKLDNERESKLPPS